MLNYETFDRDGDKIQTPTKIKAAHGRLTRVFVPQMYAIRRSGENVPGSRHKYQVYYSYTAYGRPRFRVENARVLYNVTDTTCARRAPS